MLIKINWSLIWHYMKMLHWPTIVQLFVWIIITILLKIIFSWNFKIASSKTSCSVQSKAKQWINLNKHRLNDLDPFK